MDIKIRKARPAEASELTAIAFAAKRHWEYPEEWIALWASDLSVDKEYVANNSVFVATDNSPILGWCAVSTKSDACWVDHCWVLPEATGNGIGKMLVREAFNLAAKLGCGSLKVVADPNAEGFYLRLGFVLIGEQPSLPKGRRLPVLEAPVRGEVS